MDSLAALLHRRALRLEWFTVTWNVLEAAIALGAGAAAGSIALVGFGADSLIEVTSAVGLIWRLKKAGPEASEAAAAETESMALRIVAVTFFLLGAYVGFEAVQNLAGANEPSTSALGLVLAVASLIVMPALALRKQRVAYHMGSRALRADAAETWVCAYLSLALLLGLGLNALVGWWWADPVAGLAMLPVILWQGREAWKEASDSV